MIANVKTWVENIIIVVIISIIIEMILPEGNNKKYVKVISRTLYIVCDNKSDFRARRCDRFIRINSSVLRK